MTNPNCNRCGHARIRHVQDGLGSTCLVCLALYRNPGMAGNVCTERMTFKLSQTEREQAARASKETYPPRTICAVCECEWTQHMGFLCPSGDDTFLPLLDTRMII